MKTLLAALALVPLLAACNTARPIRGEEGSPRAVVLCPPQRIEDARAYAKALNDAGYEVLTHSTSIPRETSSMAIYDVRGHPERVEDVPAILTDAGIELPEVLPFQQHAAGGNAVVVWLSSPK